MPIAQRRSRTPLAFLLSTFLHQLIDGRQNFLLLFTSEGNSVSSISMHKFKLYHNFQKRSNPKLTWKSRLQTQTRLSFYLIVFTELEAFAILIYDLHC